MTETALETAELCRQHGVEVRRILDIGSGPGVIACELARVFPSATVVAADGSEPLLEMAAARAAAAGLSDRVTTRQIELPEGVDSLGRADLVWIAMVLHHIGDEVAMLRRLHRSLNPGGVLVLVEFGEPMRFLPADAEPGRPGLNDRLAALDATWPALVRESLPDAVPSAPHAVMLEAAGFDVAVDRLAHARLDPPLPNAARRLLLGRLQRTPELHDEQLEEQDRATLEVLTDEGHPLGVMRRPDVFLDASRHVYIARAR